MNSVLAIVYQDLDVHIRVFTWSSLSIVTLSAMFALDKS